MQEQTPFWTRIRKEGFTAHAEDGAFLDRRPLTNLSELLGLGTHEGLNQMMRMSGVDEAFITGGASDYDKAEALCRVLPLWAGHPYGGAVKRLLSRTLGIEISLHPDTLPTLWERAGKELLERPLSLAELPRLFGIRRLTTALSLTQLLSLPEGYMSPEGVAMTLHLREPAGQGLWVSPLCQPLSPKDGGRLMSAAVERLADACVTRGLAGITVSLQTLTAFTRPDPYRPALSAAALQKGERLDADASALLICQLLRLLGGACIKRGMTLTLLQAPPKALLSLCDYLASCGCLPHLTVAGTDPAAALSVGASSLLHVALPISQGAFLAQLENAATRAPLGCLDGLYTPLRGALDLPLSADLHETLCGWAEAWWAS